jgi:hypothetical protein
MQSNYDFFELCMMTHPPIILVVTILNALSVALMKLEKKSGCNKYDREPVVKALRVA